MSTATPADPQDARAYLRLVVLAGAIGIPAALVAAGFFALVHYLEHWLWDDLPDVLGYESPPWFLVLGLPVAGALIVVVARLFLPGDGGHSPLGGLSAKPTPVAHGPGVALAALGSLPFGAVLGPEAPVVALGSVVGSMAARFGTHPKTAALLSSAGSFAAISTLFGGPIVAGVLLVESAAAVGLGAGVFPVLVPGLVAAAVGFLVFTGFGDWGGLETPGLVVPDLPLYDGVDFGDLGVGLVVGVLAAFVAVSVGLLARRVDGVGGRLGMPLLLVGGGLAVGGLAVLADLFGADSQDVLFSGQASVPDVVAEDSTKVLVVLIIAKFLAYGVSLGCGFRGGYIFPAIFLGVAFASFTVAWFDVSPTLAISVGAAAGMAAQTRLLITPLIFASLLVGSQGADTIPAAVFATAAAWLTVHALDRRLHPAAAQG